MSNPPTRIPIKIRATGGRNVATPLKTLLDHGDATAAELAALCKQRRHILELAALLGWTAEDLKWPASKALEKLSAETQSLARNFLRCTGTIRHTDSHTPGTTANAEWVWDKLANLPWPS